MNNNENIATGTLPEVIIKTDGSTLSQKVSEPKYEVIDCEPEHFLKIKMRLSSNPIILKAGIDGFLDTFDEFQLGQIFILRSGAVSEEFKFKTLKISRNDEGHVSNIMAVLI